MTFVEGRSGPARKKLLLHWRREARFAEDDFREAAPDLHLRDVADVRWQNDRAVLLVALDLQALKQVRVAAGVDHLPVRRGRIGNLEVVRPHEHAAAVGAMLERGG